MGNPYPATISDDNERQRIDGAVTFTDPNNQPGGASVVTCNPLAPSLDIATAATHPILWSGLQDNPWAENTLTAIPAGLGLSFAFDGTDNTITTTAAGTWAFSLSLGVGPQDATWAGHYADGLWGESRIVPPVYNALDYVPSLLVTAVMTLPVGAQLQPSIVTDTAATNPATIDASLIISRLA